MAISLGELASQFGCELVGDAATTVDNVASLHRANASSLSFLSSPNYKPQLAATAAAAVIVRADDAADCPSAALIHDNPYACYAKMAAHIHPEPSHEAGVHASAVVAGSATVAASAHLAAGVVVGEGSRIGENTYVGPGCVIGSNCTIGADGHLVANVSVVRDVRIGERCRLHPGVVIGSDGFGNAMTPEGWVKVPQLGGVRVGNDVEIGANSTIDRGALDDTVIEDGVRLDNMVHLAHNVRIGAHTAVAAQCGFAGSAIIGKRCMFAGHSGTVGHIKVCDDVVLSGKAMITKDITEPGVYAGSFAAEPIRDWNRQVARFRRLENLIRRITKLEKKTK